jgi:membrane protease YdiL (CAAX protease family)
MPTPMPSSIEKRVIAFSRSILPAEPAQLPLLLGATFLFIAPELRWGLSWATVVSQSRFGPPSVEYLLWMSRASLMTLPMWAAGAAAGFVCLVQTQRALRRLVLTVLLPSLLTLLVIPILGFVWFPEEVGLGDIGFRSVIDPSSQLPQAIPLLLRNLGPGFQIAVTGFILVAIFTALFVWGRATLPIRLRFSSGWTAADLSPEENHRTAVFVWMMICLIPLVNLLNLVLALGRYRLMSAIEVTNAASNFFVNQIIDALSLFPLVVLALGKDRKTKLRNICRSAAPNYFAVAALIPLAIASVWPLALYFLAMNHWMVYASGEYSSPKLGDYFGVPSAALLWLLLPAFVEEIAWRGYLQPRLVQKYGLVRGLFFVGIVWGAFHFTFDFRASMTTEGVVIHIFTRLTEMVALSYVLGWLTIRSRSILPATIAHGVFNLTVAREFSSLPVRTPVWIVIPAWAVLGYILFRYFPSPEMHEESTADSAANCEAAL